VWSLHQQPLPVEQAELGTAELGSRRLKVVARPPEQSWAASQDEGHIGAVPAQGLQVVPVAPDHNWSGRQGGAHR